jgi:hypothetical protein
MTSIGECDSRERIRRFTVARRSSADRTREPCWCGSSLGRGQNSQSVAFVLSPHPQTSRNADRSGRDCAEACSRRFVCALGRRAIHLESTGWRLKSIAHWSYKPIFRPERNSLAPRQSTVFEKSGRKSALCSSARTQRWLRDGSVEGRSRKARSVPERPEAQRYLSISSLVALAVAHLRRRPAHSDSGSKPR